MQVAKQNEHLVHELDLVVASPNQGHIVAKVNDREQPNVVQHHNLKRAQAMQEKGSCHVNDSPIEVEERAENVPSALLKVDRSKKHAPLYLERL